MPEKEDPNDAANGRSWPRLCNNPRQHKCTAGRFGSVERRVFEVPGQGRPSGRRQRCHQSRHTQDVHHSFGVVREDLQTHLGTHLLQGSCQEMRRPHPGLDRCERMLGSLPTNAHAVGCQIKSTLHGVEHGLIFPAAHAAIIARRALRLDWAMRAGGTPVTVHQQTALDASESPDEALPGRTTVFISRGVVDEVRLVEAALGLGRRRAGFRDDGRDSGFLAGEDLLPP